jgi:hypothetical protein
MQPRYFDATGHIDYPALEAHARQLRQEAIDAFWSSLVLAAQALVAKLRWSSGARVGASAVAHR